MHPHRPKAVWGFNGTERPGAVYLAAVTGGSHAQKGLPAFGIYGRDVQDAGDSTIPDDVADQDCSRFVRAGSECRPNEGQVVPVDRGDFDGHRRFGGRTLPSLKSYLGMRVEAIDMTESRSP